MSYYDTTTAVQFGVGPIGSQIARTAAERGIEFVGAVDIDPEKVNRELGELIGHDEDLGVKVTDDAEEALGADPDVVFHSTISSLDVVSSQLKAAMAAGADVVSTTESLIYPWWNHSDIAEELDIAATKHGVTCIGTGINPGFAMDTLPAILTSISHEVESIRVTRIQDAAERRRPLQEKIGAGVDISTFESQIAAEAGHVGLSESIAMLAAALNFDLANITETIDPVIADDPVKTEHISVESGEVAGIHQVAHGTVDGEKRIELDLRMYIGADNPRDQIEINGTPDQEIVAEGGFHGDIATSGMVVNIIPRLRESEPGLATMIDIPITSYKY